MKSNATDSTELQLLAEERSRAAADVRVALRQLPTAARRALNPIRLIRRHPLAAGAVTVIGALAVTTKVLSARRSSSRSNGRAARRDRSEGRDRSDRSWLQALSLDLVRALQQLLTAALTARLASRGAVERRQESHLDV